MLELGTVTKCEGCGETTLGVVLSLGASPPACSMRPVGTWPSAETSYPLYLLECPRCKLVQMGYRVDPEIVFHADYPYSSGNSQALHKNFEDLVKAVKPKKGDLVVDIGANDGTLLSKFPDKVNKVAVDPTEQVLKAKVDNWYQGFFDAAMARSIVEQHGHAQIVTACNVLAHVADIHNVLEGIKILLAPKGMLVAENHHLASIVDDDQWDTVYHEHLRFYSPASFTRLLQHHGLAVQGHKNIKTHGGSFRTFASIAVGVDPDRLDSMHVVDRKYDWNNLSWRARRTRDRLREILADFHLRQERVWAIGSAARATTVIAFCGLDTYDIEAVCEVAGSDKIGHFMPGTSIPVIDEAALYAQQPDAVVLFSWHMADFIVPKLREKGYRGKIITPLPHVRFVG